MSNIFIFIALLAIGSQFIALRLAAINQCYEVVRTLNSTVSISKAHRRCISIYVANVDVCFNVNFNVNVNRKLKVEITNW